MSEKQKPPQLLILFFDIIYIIFSLLSFLFRAGLISFEPLQFFFRMQKCRNDSALTEEVFMCILHLSRTFWSRIHWSAECLISQLCKNKRRPGLRGDERSRERQVPYKILSYLSSVDLLYEEKSNRKRTLNKSLGIFKAERLIALIYHLLLKKDEI